MKILSRKEYEDGWKIRRIHAEGVAHINKGRALQRTCTYRYSIKAAEDE
jgi:hypothetical protein